MTTQLNYKTRTPKKMLGATLKLKAQPSQGVALEKHFAQITVCAAGKTGYLNFSCGSVLARATHVIRQAIMRMRVKIWPQLVRATLPMGSFTYRNYLFARNPFFLKNPTPNHCLRYTNQSAKCFLGIFFFRKINSHVILKFHNNYIVKPIVSFCQTPKVIFI